MQTSFLPIPAEIKEITPLTSVDRLFLFEASESIRVLPGQFVEITLPGAGGFPISPCDLTRDRQILSCIRKTGRVTSALFERRSGTSIGLRGPFGNGFDLTAFDHRDALLIAGGLGIAPLRALLAGLLKRSAHRRLLLLFGARTCGDLLFRHELLTLSRHHAIELLLSIDESGHPEEENIPCRVGLVTSLLDGIPLAAAETTAAVSGPPALYHGVLEHLARLGLPPDKIFATLERRMRCGLGECCHCVTGGVYLCRDGPVFSLSELRTMEGALT